MKFGKWVGATLAGAMMAMATSGHAGAAELVFNGDFSSDLSGWTPVTTPNGTVGVPAVVSFDVTGSGPQNSLQLNAGQVVFNGHGLPAEGGGVFQSFTAINGSFNFSASIASFNSTWVGYNASGGILSAFIDDILISSFDFSFIAPEAVERSQLSYTGNISAGLHKLELRAARPFFQTYPPVLQYFTNVSITQPSPPRGR
jgi:hypothetical protein